MRVQIKDQVEKLLARYETEPSHVRHVAKLADQLFIGLRPWHKMGESHRELLAVAALLHDVGWSKTPTGAGHHKYSAEIILKFDWTHLPAEDVNLVALVARYHRKSPPQSTHKAYHFLSIENQRVIDILAGVLRVADSLDRTHTSAVGDLEVKLDKKAIYLGVPNTTLIPAELVALDKKKDLLELASGRIICIEPSSLPISKDNC